MNQIKDIVKFVIFKFIELLLQNTLKSKKHINKLSINNIDQKDIVDQPSTSKTENIKNNPKSLKELAREEVKLDNKQLNKELAKKYEIPTILKINYFINFLKINLDSHQINHLNSKITISSITEHNEIDMDLINRLVKEMSIIYARLIDQYKFKYQCTFLARFDKLDEDRVMLDETELFINLNINHNLTESDLNKINVISTLKSQIQNQEMKDSGWRFDKIINMTIYFYKTQELNGSSYVKLPLRSNAILNIQNEDKFCFIWSILAHIFPVLDNPQRVSNYKKYFDKLNIQGFDFTNGFIVSDVKKFEKLNNLKINIFELSFYQEDKIWKHKLIPLEISENKSGDYEIDLLIYKNHYVLIKKLHVFFGKYKCRYVCRRCLSSYSSEKVLEKHKFKCNQQEITSIRTSNESHIYWKKYFHKIPLYFRVYGDLSVIMN